MSPATQRQFTYQEANVTFNRRWTICEKRRLNSGSVGDPCCPLIADDIRQGGELGLNAGSLGNIAVFPGVTELTTPYKRRREGFR